MNFKLYKSATIYYLKNEAQVNKIFESCRPHKKNYKRLRFWFHENVTVQLNEILNKNGKILINRQKGLRIAIKSEKINAKKIPLFIAQSHDRIKFGSLNRWIKTRK